MIPQILEFQKQKPLLLIVEDEIDLAERLQLRLQNDGFDVTYEGSISEGITVADKFGPSIIILDQNLPDGTSLSRLNDFINNKSGVVPKIILTTSDTNATTFAIFDDIQNKKLHRFVKKPYDFAQVSSAVYDLMMEDDQSNKKTFTYTEQAVQKAIDIQNESLSQMFFFGSCQKLIDSVNKVKTIFEKITEAEQLGKQPDKPIVLITGETGVGKTALYKLITSFLPPKTKHIHFDAPRFTEEMLTLELFGAVKGSYSGSDLKKDKIGVFEDVGNGIVFIDEIGEAPMSIQPKLLVPLEQRSFFPLGSTSSKPINCFIVMATNKNLKQMVSKGEFREDLYNRISKIHIHIPPLRERMDDIYDIAQTYINKQLSLLENSSIFLHQSAVDLLKTYNWPGNIRELENVLFAIYLEYSVGNLKIFDGAITNESIQDIFNQYVAQNNTIVDHKKISEITPQFNRRKTDKENSTLPLESTNFTRRSTDLKPSLPINNKRNFSKTTDPKIIKNGKRYYKLLNTFDSKGKQPSVSQLAKSEGVTPRQFNYAIKMYLQSIN